MVAPVPGERSGAGTATIEIDFGDIRVRIPAATPGELACAVIKALASR
jgi:hypothetical protein